MKIVDNRNKNEMYFYLLQYGDFFEFDSDEGLQLGMKTTITSAYIFRREYNDEISKKLIVIKVKAFITIED